MSFLKDYSNVAMQKSWMSFLKESSTEPWWFNLEATPRFFLQIFVLKLHAFTSVASVGTRLRQPQQGQSSHPLGRLYYNNTKYRNAEMCLFLPITVGKPYYFNLETTPRCFFQIFVLNLHAFTSDCLSRNYASHSRVKAANLLGISITKTLSIEMLKCVFSYLLQQGSHSILTWQRLRAASFKSLYCNYTPLHKYQFR